MANLLQIYARGMGAGWKSNKFKSHTNFIPQLKECFKKNRLHFYSM